MARLSFLSGFQPPLAPSGAGVPPREGGLSPAPAGQRTCFCLCTVVLLSIPPPQPGRVEDGLPRVPRRRAAPRRRSTRCYTPSPRRGVLSRSQPGTTPPFPSLRLFSIHFTLLHFTLLYFTLLSFTLLYSTSFDFTFLPCSSLCPLCLCDKTVFAFRVCDPRASKRHRPRLRAVGVGRCGR